MSLPRPTCSAFIIYMGDLCHLTVTKRRPLAQNSVAAARPERPRNNR